MDDTGNRRPRENLEFLLLVTSTLNRSAKLEDVLEVTLTATTEISGFELCGIYLQEHPEGRASLIASRGLPQGVEPLGLWSKTIESPRPESGGDVGEYSPRKEDVGSEDLETMRITPFIRIPLVGKTGIIGSVHLASLKDKQLSADKIKLLKRIGMEAGQAIERTLSQRKLNDAYVDSVFTCKQMQYLCETSLGVSSFTQREKILLSVAKRARDLFDADSVKIFLYNAHNNKFNFGVSSDYKTEPGLSTSFDASLGISGKLLKEGLPSTAFLNYLTDSSFQHSTDLDRCASQENLVSGMAAAMILDGSFLGAIVLANKLPSFFTDEDQKILRTFANIASASIANIQLRREETEKSHEELEAAQEKIVRTEKILAPGQMASGVAHYFNNFLSIIMGNTELLMEMCQDEKVKERLHILYKAGLKAAETIKRLQGLYQKEGDEELNEIDLNKAVTEAIELTKPLWKDQRLREGRPVELIFNPGEMGTTLGKETALREVITNVVLNAVDAMPHGGEIQIETYKSGNANIIKIKDNGIGMAPEIKGRIFEPFFTTKEEGSSGLGLSISYAIVARHNGQIEVESREGIGSTFIISLPISQPSDKISSHPAPKETPYRARILVVDDEDYILDFFTAALTAKGHEVVIARTSLEGINRIEGETFDIVFTDLGMPGSSGWDVVTTAKKKNKDTFAALITGWAYQLSQKELESHQIDALLPKPMSIHSIRNIVAQLMEQKMNRNLPRS